MSDVTTAAPHRIFVVRHGDRYDREVREWAQTSDRPHDTTLSDTGKLHSHKLGAFLRSVRAVDPANVVVLASPLTRCVQTAHHIVEGLLAGQGELQDERRSNIAIFLEHGLCEGAYWLQIDMNCNKNLAVFPPQPVLHGADHHRVYTSSRVQPEPFGLCQPPEYFVSEDGELCERIGLRQRCATSARSLLNAKELFGKVVICVGHGETTKLWVDAIVGKPHPDNGRYTGVAELALDTTSDGQREWAHQLHVFSTPHLEPSD